MDQDMQAVILSVIDRAPQWVRRELQAKDERARAIAEEALAAMIADALKMGTGEAVATADN